MCGLIAALQTRPRLSDERLTAGLEVIAHRGPDHTGRWWSVDRLMALGHVRLSIIGLDNGDQPILDGSGDVACVVNGELYGYRGLRERLRSDGHAFTTDSDSEVALRLFERDGLDFVEQLRGEFAIVIADQRRGRLLAIRDRFGVKPLYYAVHDGNVYFASEIKALMALGVPLRWDPEAFFAECHSVRPPERTLFEGVSAVPPGCMAIARGDRVEIRPYWDTAYPRREELADDERSDDEVVEGFRRALDDAVSERMVADVEVAAYLSGGIDSCAVLGLAQRHLSRPIRAFTIAFDDALYDERKLAERTAEYVGARFVPVPVDQTQIAEAFADAIWHAEHLVFNGHGVAKYLLSRAVHDAGIKVVFTGEGADEILGGYPPFRRDLILHNTEGQDPDAVARMLADLDAANRSSRGLLVSDGAAAPGIDALEDRLGFVPSWIQAQSTLSAKMYPVFHDEYRETQLRANPYAGLLRSLDVRGRLDGRDPVNQSLYLWTRTLLPNYVLSYLGDRMEMAHSVEGRVPFLDHHVAEYAAGIAVRHKIRGMREKHVLREAVRDHVLPDIYDRHKHPFMTPPARSGDDLLAVYCQDVLRSDVVDEQPFFDPERVRQLMDGIDALTPDARAALDGVILRMVSACVLQERFRPTA